MIYASYTYTQINSFVFVTPSILQYSDSHKHKYIHELHFFCRIQNTFYHLHPWSIRSSTPNFVKQVTKNLPFSPSSTHIFHLSTYIYPLLSTQNDPRHEQHSSENCVSSTLSTCLLYYMKRIVCQYMSSHISKVKKAWFLTGNSLQPFSKVYFSHIL